MIFGARVEQAREFRCLTQTELAAAIGVQQTAIARLEAGTLTISDAKVDELAVTLGFPRSFFERDVPEFFALGSLQFRTNAATPAKERKRAHQYASIVFELALSLAKRLKMPAMRLPRLEGDSETAAARLRSDLGISPNTPIRNLTAALERSGVYVFSLPDLRAGCDGFSVWGGVDRKLLPAIYVSADSAGDRARHTLAHEVGELTLEDVPVKRAEHERFASEFAGAFLMPPDAFRRDLVPPLDLADFLEIKRRYGVSAQSAIVRARQLGIISARRYAILFRSLGSLGWRTEEPPEYSVPRERPRALYKMVELLYGQSVDWVSLAEDAKLDPWLVKTILTTHASTADLKNAQAVRPIDNVVPLRVPVSTRTHGNEEALEC